MTTTTPTLPSSAAAPTATPEVPATRVLTAVVAGVATTAYYASPDLIRSRARRGWAKAGLAAVITATSVPEMLRSRAQQQAAQAHAAREAAAARAADGVHVTDGTDADDVTEPVDWRQLWSTMPTRGRVSVGAAAAGFLGVSAAVVVGAERWVFRRGERRRAEGVRWAHTRPAVVWGVVSTVFALVPMDERR